MTSCCVPSLPLLFKQTHTHTVHNKLIYALVKQLRMCVFLCSQYEQLTQMKSAFETRMQRQHELSEVGGYTHHTEV